MTMRIAPQFLVADLGQAIEYFRDKLGFEQKIAYEDFYASVARDGAEIHLKCAEQCPGERAHRMDNNHIDTMIETTGIEALYAELSDRGAIIHQPLQTQPWGTTDFAVRDRDGHIICFAEQARD